jgi:hypothetical protein
MAAVNLLANLLRGKRNVCACATVSGFLVKNLTKALPGLAAFGFDISRYAPTKCGPEVVWVLE